MAQALQQVAAEGWTEEARFHAESALLAMSDKQTAVDQEWHDHDHQHIMLSYQWNVQEMAKCIVNELQARGYRTWFGAPRQSISRTRNIVQSPSRHRP